MPREIELTLNALRQRQVPNVPLKELADQFGLSETTLRGYLENRWRVLDRTILERFSDYFGCDAGSLITTQLCEFFVPFSIPSEADKRRKYYRLIRPDARASLNGRLVSFRDHQAADLVDAMLREWVDGIVGIVGSAVDLPDFDPFLAENCVVFGTPAVNPAAEMAICKAFGVEPFDAKSSAKLPIVFRTNAWNEASKSALLEAPIDGKQGIWLRKESQLIPTNSWSGDEFKPMRIPRGRDCALVLVMNHNPGPPNNNARKLIVLSGCSGVGTQAAATALEDSYRDLEPRADENVVWGVIEVLYKKKPSSMTREILGYNWRYRSGGRSPLGFVKKSD